MAYTGGFKDDRTAATVAKSASAASIGNYERSLDLLAVADGFEAWAGAPCGIGSRAAIAATISHVSRQRAAVQLAAEFGDDVSEWTV